MKDDEFRRALVLGVRLGLNEARKICLEEEAKWSERTNAAAATEPSSGRHYKGGVLSAMGCRSAIKARLGPQEIADEYLARKMATAHLTVVRSQP